MQDARGPSRESNGAGLAGGAVRMCARGRWPQPARQSPIVMPSQPMTER